MDIKTFISESLTQIAEGIVDAQMRTADTGMLTNPHLQGSETAPMFLKKMMGEAHIKTSALTLPLQPLKKVRKA